MKITGSGWDGHHEGCAAELIPSVSEGWWWWLLQARLQGIALHGDRPAPSNPDYSPEQCV